MKSPFGKCIENLRKEHQYTQQDVIDNAVNENGGCVISSLSAYRKIIAGERNSPRNFDEILAALARLYNVTTDYLLGIEDEPRHVKSVNETTGLSTESVNALQKHRKNNPNIIKMLNALISSPGILESILKQFFEDYVEYSYHSGNLDTKEHDKLIQGLYSDLLRVISKSLSGEFDRMYKSNLPAISSKDVFINTPEYGQFLFENGKKYADEFISKEIEPDSFYMNIKPKRKLN